MPRSATGLGAKTCAAGPALARGAARPGAGAASAIDAVVTAATTAALLMRVSLTAGLQPQQGDERLGVAGGGERADRALVLDDLALDLLAVGEAEALDP